MIKLFDPENKFWQFLNKVTDAALMSLQPGIHSSKQQLSFLRPAFCPFYMVQNPFNLCGGKVGIRH